MSVFGYLLVGFALGGVLGAVIGWLMGSRRVTAAETELKLLKEQLANERQQIDKLQERFRKEFEAISNKLLVDNSNSFNRQSTDSLEKLLSPLKEKLGEFKASLDKTHDATTVNNALLKDQVSQIGMEAARLSKALKGDAKVLGNWGENMLDKILEKSGLQRDVHYRRQQSVKGEDGDQRYLDVVVELQGLAEML
jgi:DNA recombination protein RmuC